MNPNQIAQQPVQPAPTPQGVVPAVGPAGVQTPGQAPPKPKNPNSTQSNMLFSEIREGMVIMNDGSYRAIVACDSINFDLMSIREKEGVEYTYQSFLNSLYFPIQILVRSEKVDIGPYLRKLSEIRGEQDNMLLGVMMDDYMDFIANIAQVVNIMDKSFYVVVPYFTVADLSALAGASKSIFSVFSKSSPTSAKIRISEDVYNKAKEELGNRVSAIQSGLMQMGVKTKVLDTKEIGELFYNVYNPDTASKQKITEFDVFENSFIQKEPVPQDLMNNPGANNG